MDVLAAILNAILAITLASITDILEYYLKKTWGPIFERCLVDVWKVLGRSLEDVCKVSGRCLEGILSVLGSRKGRCLEYVWKVSKFGLTKRKT